VLFDGPVGELARQLESGVCFRLTTVAETLNGRTAAVLPAPLEPAAERQRPTRPLIVPENAGCQKAWILSSIAQKYL
jgi:hypothetical protein